MYVTITLSKHQILVDNKPMFISNPHSKVINQLITPYAKVIKTKDMFILELPFKILRENFFDLGVFYTACMNFLDPLIVTHMQVGSMLIVDLAKL